jgi:ATP-dependent helicase/nuclease subunit B
MPVTIGFAAIEQELCHNCLLITPNARSQKAVISGYMQSASHHQVVQAPAILSLSEWLDELWQGLSFVQVLPKVVSDLAIKIWLKALIEQNADWQLTNALGVAEKVLEAYRNLGLWNKSLADLKAYFSEQGSDLMATTETIQFQKWAIELETFLASKNLIPSFKKIEQLKLGLDSLLESNLMPSKILLVGFNQLTPLESSLLEACQALGINLVEIKQSPPAGKTKKEIIQLKDFKQELQLAANKALEFKQNKDKKQQSMAIVVHQLSSHLATVEPIFAQVFQPQHALPWQPVEKNQYNISAGTPLSELAIVNAALKLLQLNAKGFDLVTLSFLKNSAFINWGEHHSVIKRFLHQLSLQNFSHYSLRFLIRKIDKSQFKPQLELLKTRLLNLNNQDAYGRPIAAWVNVWHQVLNQWGWCQADQSSNQDHNNSIELTESQKQIQIALFDAFSQCQSLGVIYDRVSQHQANEYLQQLLKKTVFQQASDRSNIQILGTLEAVGLDFDELILVGFNQDNWPQKVKLNPFLPIAFQQQYFMPSSSAEKEFDYAYDLSKSLLASSSNILVTASLNLEGGLNASQMFNHLKVADFDLGLSLSQRTPVLSNYTWHQDEQVNVAAGDIGGGAYMLSYYADCPFKAMSKNVLKIVTQDQATKGIDAKLKGSWLHMALEIFWLQVQTQQNLLAFSNEELISLIEQAVLKAKDHYQSQLDATASAELIKLETEKLMRVIFQWLAIDKSRQPFKALCEQPKYLTLGQLNFKLSIDRIDQLDDGRIAIIDYKSGNVDIKKWFGQRPEEAQMPAYALACVDEAVASLAYAKLRTGEVEEQGIYFASSDPLSFDYLITNENNKINKTKTFLNNNKIDTNYTLAEQWQQNLTALSNKIVNGDMPVSPKNTNLSCRYCDYKPFCRIDENQPNQYGGSELNGANAND